MGIHRRKLGLLALLAAVFAVGFTLLPVTAGAVHDINVFELDGNAIDGSGAGLPDDWSSLFPTDTSADDLGKTFVTDKTGAEDDGFGSGLTKDTQDIPNWTWVTGAISPEKDDILHAYAATYVKNNEQLLYFGQDRAPKPNGSTAMGFWFFQNPVATNPNGTFSGTHKDGDLLVTSDMTQGGVVSEINLFRWQGGGLVQTAHLTSADCGTASAGDVACGIANSGGEIDVPWDYPTAGQHQKVPANIFFEGGVSLTDLFQGQNIPCFSNFLADTRTSPSETADLKDFALGSIDTCGTITIHKDAQPDDPNASFDFSATGSGLSGFSLTDNGTKEFSKLQPGQFSVNETGMPADWTFDSVSCSPEGPGTSVQTNGSQLSITLGLGGNVDCTYVNKRKPRVKLVKDLDPDNDPGRFDLTLNGTTSNNGGQGYGDGGTTGFVTVPAGAVTIAESAHTGTDLAKYASSVSCDSAKGGGSGTSHSFSVANGDSVTCTFTNHRKRGTLIVKKVVVNDNGGTKVASDFSFQVNGGSAVAFEADGQNELTVDAGTYDVTEPAVDGYATSYNNCDDVVVPDSGTATCTITNNDKAAKLIVVKHVVNDDGGTKVAGDFHIDVAGIDASPNSFAGAEAPGTEVTLDAGPYVVGETPDPGYAVSYSTECDGSIGLGETKTCTVTNDDKPAKLIVKKVVINNNGGTKAASDFSFQVNGGSAVAFEADGQNELTVDAGTYDVTEPAVDGYATSYDNCADVVVPNGGTATCTITNDDKAGTLIVKKVVINNNGGTKVASDFSFQVNGGSAVAFEADGRNDLTVNAGTYNVVEPAVAGYTTSYDNCADVVVPNGGTATCTITNDDNVATLIVKKVVVNNDGGTKTAEDFSFTVNGGSAVAFEADGENQLNVDAGAYNVVEPAVAGYTTTYAGCSDIVIANGETKTCTITNNDQPATLIVKKVVKNDDGGTKTAGDFSFSVNGGSAVSFEADGENVLTVAAGSYDVTEPHVDGYTTSYEGCSDIELPNGGSATCTITNDDQPATLIVKKVVVNDEGGTKTAGDFSFSVNGDDPVSFEADGQNNLTVPAGTYTVVEPAVDGYATSYAGCSEIVIPNGGTATCTITNDDDIPPTVDVTKDANVASINEPGGDVIFTVTVWNTSHEAVTLTSLVDNVYGNLDKDDVGNHSWVSSLCDTGGTLGATDGTRGGADTYACTFVGSVKGDGPATHTNEVTVVVTDDEGDTGTDKDTATVAIKDVPPPPPPPPAPQIDLSVTKVDTPDPATLNGQIGYTMLVTNAGPSTATGVTLADPLPAGTSYVSSSTTQGTCSFGNGLLQCSLGTIPVGGSVSVSLVVRATQAGVLTNEVTVVGKEPEPNTANNRATATTFVPTPLTPPTPKPKAKPKPKPAPAVCSTLTVGPKTLSVGKRSTIAAIVRNRGKAVKGAKVLVRGPGFAKSGRTNAGGVARITVTPVRPGITVVSVQQKLTCGTKRIGVVGVFEPPVTG